MHHAHVKRSRTSFSEKSRSAHSCCAAAKSRLNLARCDGRRGLPPFSRVADFISEPALTGTEGTVAHSPVTGGGRTANNSSCSRELEPFEIFDPFISDCFEQDRRYNFSVRSGHSRGRPAR